MTTPDFFIVGAPKCGTTAMYQWLVAHPEVFLPRKEVHFFGEDLDHRRPPITTEDYLALYEGAQEAHRRVGDVGVWHLMSTSAASEIAAMSPDAHIIIMLRRPDEMLYSLHSQLVYSGDEDLTDFSSALDAESARSAGKHIPVSTHTGQEAPPTQCLQYRRVASFADQVSRYQQAFDNVHVVLHDDLRADAAGVFRGVLEFLQIDPEVQPDFSVVNPNTQVRSQAARKAIQGLRWGPLRSAVPAPIRGVGRRVMEGLQSLNTDTTKRPPLDPAIGARIRADLREDVERLAAQIDRDLSTWLEARSD